MKNTLNKHNMIVKHVTWINGFNGSVGIINTINESGEKTIRIGIVPGNDEKKDIEFIKSFGSKISFDDIKTMYKHIATPPYEFVTKRLTWTGAIDYATKRGKYIPSETQMKQIHAGNDFDIELWTSTTDPNVTNFARTNKGSKIKTGTLSFIMVDHIIPDQKLSYYQNDAGTWEFCK